MAACCEKCPKYEMCEDNYLESNCCPKCPTYYECTTEGAYDSYADTPEDTDNEDSY